MQALILVLVFLGTAALIAGGYAFANRRRLSAAEASRARLMGLSGDRPSGAVSILRDDRASGVGFLNSLLEGKSFTAWMARELTRAGSKRKVGEFVLGSVVAGVLGFFLVDRFAGPAIGLLVAVLAVFVPFLNVRRLQGKRNAKFEEQLPDAIDMLVNAMRAGYSLQAAMEFVGKEVPDPLGPEFSRFYDEQRFGVDARTALLNMQERVGTGDLKMFVTSLLIQRETGGNLGEILTNLSTLMRDRVAFRGQVKTLTAEGKMSQKVLTALPIGLFFFLVVSNREYMNVLLTTEKGHLMLTYAGISVIVGYFVMSKIARVEM